MKRVCYLFVFLYSLVISLPATGQHPLMLSGDHEAEQGNYTSAISYYSEALEKFPYNYHLFKKLGESYRLSGAFEEALGWYEKCIITGKFSREDSCRHAELLLMNGRIEKAGAALEDLKRGNPEDKEVMRLQQNCRFAATELAKTGLPPVENCEELNSPGNETGLSNTSEGLLFSSNRPGRDFLTVDDLNASGGADLYLARRNGKTNAFERPVRFSGKLNTPQDETGFTMSNVSQMSFISRTEPFPGKSRIFTAKRTKNQWTDIIPVNLGDGAFNYEHPALSTDGLTLWFVSDMPGGMGGKDLWKVPVTPSGEIGIPVNAGTVINTSEDEDYPSVWGDTLLVFSSKGHTGMGGMDIFYCRLEGNVTSQPVNAGAPVNSTVDDHSVWFDHASGGVLFCSNRNAGLGSDIFRFRHSFVLAERILKNLRDNGDIEDSKDSKDNSIISQEMNKMKVLALTDTKEEAPPGVPIVVEPVPPPALAPSIPSEDTSAIFLQKEVPSEVTVDTLVTPGNTVFYRIQIAAAVKPITSFSQFSKLNDLIDFYGLSVDKAGNHYKYRIGNFDDREAATRVWKTIRERGYRDCYIVPVE
ncbi:MAG TPA: SPOR domain-containing protein [Prolixibacteraceae bacterium]|nr:SPOR domain-containing protein [Prolixibacteraceae bacterium]